MDLSTTGVKEGKEKFTAAGGSKAAESGGQRSGPVAPIVGGVHADPARQTFSDPRNPLAA
jgi:hypothetical protein